MNEGIVSARKLDAGARDQVVHRQRRVTYPALPATPRPSAETRRRARHRLEGLAGRPREVDERRLDARGARIRRHAARTRRRRPRTPV